MKQQYEFHAYPGDEHGAVAATAEISTQPCISESEAKAVAGRLAKRINGPVDLAYAGGAEWAERYITTASPCEFRIAGFRLGRIE